jgi:hypothetical protein
LGRGIEHSADAFFRQIFQGRLTPPRSHQRDIWVERLRQTRRINADLRHVPVRLCAREKRTITSLDKHVKDGRFKGWIGCVTVCFPAAIYQIDLDATRNWPVAVDPNCSIAKIRAGFTIPNTKLNDVDFVAIRADEFFPEISRKPTRLQLQLGWNPW